MKVNNCTCTIRNVLWGYYKRITNSIRQVFIIRKCRPTIVYSHSLSLVTIAKLKVCLSTLQLRFDYSCDSSIFCNHNISILTDILNHLVGKRYSSEKKKQRTRCALIAAEQLVDQYSARLLLAYQEHMAKSSIEQEKEEEESIPIHDRMLKQQPRVIVPLIDRFQKVDPEMLRLSDELKEMADESLLWIQRSIFCFYFSVICICLIREFVRYRRRRFIDF